MSDNTNLIIKRKKVPSKGATVDLLSSHPRVSPSSTTLKKKTIELEKLKKKYIVDPLKLTN